MSWVPTIKIARAAWRGRRDPAGLLKAQLAPDESPAAAAQLSAASVASAPAGAALPQPAAVIVSEPLAQAHEDPTHHHLLLLLR
ncbi:MAG: hypothetical protein ABSD82_04320 [Solirubrobacteraceae bacterium]